MATETRDVMSQSRHNGELVTRIGTYARIGLTKTFVLTHWRIDVGEGYTGCWHRVHGNQTKPVAGFRILASEDEINRMKPWRVPAYGRIA